VGGHLLQVGRAVECVRHGRRRGWLHAWVIAARPSLRSAGGLLTSPSAVAPRCPEMLAPTPQAPAPVKRRTERTRSGWRVFMALWNKHRRSPSSWRNDCVLACAADARISRRAGLAPGDPRVAIWTL